MTRALLVVDVQNDFVEGGALAVAGGNAVAEKIDYFIDQEANYDLTIASRDMHNPLPDTNCGHFDDWPVHCVAGTDGAKFHSSLKGIEFDAIVNKGMGTQSYSAFEGVTADYRTLLAILRSANVDTVDVVGLATDWCVRQTVMDGLGLGFRVRVLLDMCAGVDPARTNQAVTDMRKRGACIVKDGRDT